MTDLRSPQTYQQLIARHTQGVDPRHVEAWMRLEHRTLDGLSATDFTHAMFAALGSVNHATPRENEALAASFWL